METLDKLLNPYVLAYLLIVPIALAAVFRYSDLKREKIATQRENAGLPRERILMNHVPRLAELRWEALSQVLVLFVAIIAVPFLLTALAQGDPEAQRGLALTFIVAVIWLLWMGIEVGKSFLGGLAFKVLIAIKHPIQVGDWVTLGGRSGKVMKVGLFYVTLQSPNEGQVNVPSASLWSEVLISANAGERSSLCVMDFYLATFVSVEQRKATEAVIQDAIQASTYMEVFQPTEIYLSQEPDAIRLTAKAYVASTDNESLFKTEVYRAFLDFVSREGIPLAASSWRQVVLSPQ